MIGSAISHYRIVQLIGSGGMGKVFKAEDLTLHRYVAMKFLPEELTQSAEALERFRREARAASALNHPNICTIYEFGEHGGQLFLVMEYLEGETLRQCMAKRRVRLHELIEWGVQVAGALHCAHQSGIVHRDIKPANILLMSDLRVKILDFGVAKTLVRELGAENGRVKSDDNLAGTFLTTIPAQVSALTRWGAAVGTLQYMSPEQVLGTDVDARADIFSLGVVLYEMASGESPFECSSGPELISAILCAEPPPIRHSSVPRELERVIRKCLDKNRELRYRAAADLAADLRALRRSSDTGRQALGPEGNAGNPEHGSALRRAAVMAGLVVLGVVMMLWTSYPGRWRAWPPSSSPIMHSVAVLPLNNLSKDPEQEYFADGITDELIADLGRIRTLAVISRNSVMTYRGTQKSLNQIARELKVDDVVEGSVLRSGGRVRITAELVRTEGAREIWADSYTRELRDVLSVQSDVARDIATHVSVLLTPQERELFSGSKPVKPEAYDAYLRGKYYWNEVTDEGLRKSIGFFREALEEEPSFAKPYVGIADACILMGNWGFTAERQAFTEAKANASEALKLNPKLGEAYAALAYAEFMADWDWRSAEEHFRKALELSPNYAPGRLWHTLYLRSAGRFDEALQEAVRGQQLDPLSPLMEMTIGSTYYTARRYEEARAALERALARAPSLYGTHHYLGLSYLGLGEYDQALREFQGRDDILTALTDLSMGRRGPALGIIKNIKAQPEADDDDLEYACVYAALGDKEEALRRLEHAYKEREPSLVSLKTFPLFDGLRSDPRFQEILHGVGFP